MEISKENWNLKITTDEKVQIVFNKCSINLDWMTIDFPGEYEKSGILVTVKEYSDCNIFDLKIEWKNVAFVDVEKIEKPNEVLDFFWDIDILLILGNKENAKLTEEIDAKMIVPYWDAKDIFLNSLGQNIEAQAKYKFKETDFSWETSNYLNIE